MTNYSVTQQQRIAITGLLLENHQKQKLIIIDLKTTKWNTTQEFKILEAK